jgi:hypothetical protein
LILLVLALPAQAADPLLSGYAGPGSGEQVVLGSQTVGKGGGGGGPAGGAGAAASADLRATAPAATTSPSGAGAAATPSSDHAAKAKRKKPSSSSSKQKMGSATSTSSTDAARQPGVPRVVAYPTRAGAVSGFPVSLGDVLLAIAALALLALGVLGLRRLTAGSDDPPAPQVPVS